MRERDIMAGEQWRMEQLGYMRQELLSLKTGVEIGYWDLQNEVDRLTGDIKYHERVLEWYSGTVHAILDRCNHAEAGFSVRLVRSTGAVEEVEERPSAVDLLRQCNKAYGDTEQRLSQWIGLLVGHGLLDGDPGLDLEPPVHEARRERMRAEREAARQWQRDFDGVLEAVARHVQKVGKPSVGYARARALQLWNLTAGDGRRSDDNMRQWIQKLHGEKLLPAGAWLRGQGRHAVRKLLEVVT
jgi:hypothetical protein